MDYTFILICICAIPAFFFGWWLIGTPKKPVGMSKELTEMEIKEIMK